MDEYTVKITGIVEDCAQKTLYTTGKTVRELMELDDDVYNVILSDHKLKLKDSEVAVTNTKESVQDQIQSVIDDLQQIIIVMILLGAVLCVAAVYLTVNMMVEENGNTISMLKIFGYRKGEINSMVLSANHILVPISLVISIPLSFFAGLGGASHEGVLIKGSNYLETLSKTKVVVFDKTGTLTQGVFDVTGVHHNSLPREKVLEYAALAECASSHPISRSLQRAYGGHIDRDRVTDIREYSGNGVVARVDGVTVAVGNDKLMDKLGIAWHDCHSVGTIIHLALDGQYAGHIVISDVEKPHAKDAIAALKRIGVEKTVMLTGDRAKVADHVAQDLGVDEVHSELLPADKVSQVERLLSRAGGKLAFVGDGINDAPVLSRADIGIAMGAMGSDAAIEAADVVLMDDDPLKIAKAIRISRKCIRIVYENIAFALIVKALCLLLVAVGAANMWAAIFGDVGVMVIAVLNAIRALRVSKL